MIQYLRILDCPCGTKMVAEGFSQATRLRISGVLLLRVSTWQLGGLGLHQHSQGLGGEGCSVTDERSRGIRILFGEVTRFSVDLRLLVKGYSKKDFAESARKEDLLPIFFLNLDKSTDRLDTLWKDFDALPDFLSSNLQLQRVPAVSTAAVESMLENNVLRFNEGITLTYSKRVSTNTGGQYTFNEAACTLSHLKAIWQAYDAGHEMVLIIEDHVMLTSDFFENWKAYAELAPDDWQILQWTTGNVAINKRELYRGNDYWISWKPTHYGAIAYTIRREGMKRILDHTHVTDTHNGGTSFDRWEFNEPNILVSDELIYYLAQNVYTSTFPWISTKKVASTMG
eukprot:scaffold1792_cov288-Chaetoceros_neogracile.AAC.4